MAEQKTHYSASELADLAGISTARLRQILIVGRELRGVKIAGNWAIPIGEAERWLAERKRDRRYR